jgi:hypothetical protein
MGAGPPAAEPHDTLEPSGRLNSTSPTTPPFRFLARTPTAGATRKQKLPSCSPARAACAFVGGQSHSKAPASVAGAATRLRRRLATVPSLAR